MSKSYAAAIEIIQIALDEHKGTCAVRWVANLQSAIRILKAAGKVDKHSALCSMRHSDANEAWSGLDDDWRAINALLSALPDKKAV